MLKEFGISSEWVLSGEEALIKIAEAHSNESDYDAVIVDWKMPVMDGLETTRQIRRIMGDAIPIIILTAYDWEEIAEAAKNMGVNTFLTKPLFRSHLYHVILQIMTGKQADKVDERTDTLVGTNTLKGHVLLVESWMGTRPPGRSDSWSRMRGASALLSLPCRQMLLTKM